MMKTKNKSLYKHIGLATLGAALMLGLVLIPGKKAKAAPSTLPAAYVDEYDALADEYKNDYCFYRANTDGTLGTVFLFGNVQNKPENTPVDSSGYINDSGIILPSGIKTEVANNRVKDVIALTGTTFPADSRRLFHSLTKYYEDGKDGNKNLSNIDLANANTSSVTNMSYMFYEVSDLATDPSFELTIDISGFDTTNVTDMSYMFYKCSYLREINFGTGFNTTNVTTMERMFDNCNYLESLDLSSFNTSNVTTMKGMFNHSRHLTSITFGSSFNTANVTDMEDMFRDVKLTSLDLSSLNTSSVTNMSGIFMGAEDLTSVNLSGFNTSSVTDMSNMFDGCTNLQTITFGDNFNTSSVTNMYAMFYNCKKLGSLDLSEFDTSNVQNMGAMFESCESLTNLDLSDFNTAKVYRMDYMFYHCNLLNTIKTGTNFKTSEAYQFEYIFADCPKLTSIFVTQNWDLSEAIGAVSKNCFKGCTSLTGGSGTKYDSSVYETDSVDVQYARIDGGVSAPGYFTSMPSILGALDADTDNFTLKIYIPVDLANNHLEDYYITFGVMVYDSIALSHMYDNVVSIGEKDYFYLPMNCSAKEIADTRNLTVKLNNTEIYNENLSVASYLKLILATPSYSAHHAVAGSILRYGAAAQIYFNYNYSGDSTKLANYGIDSKYSIDSLNTISVPEKDFSVTNINNALQSNNTGFVYGGINITFGKNSDKLEASDNALMLAFKPEDGSAASSTNSDGRLDALSALLSRGKDTTVTSITTFENDKNDKYKIVKVYVPIKQLGKPIYTIGGTELSFIQYMNLACNTSSGCTDELKNLCKALYGYYTAVNGAN